MKKLLLLLFIPFTINAASLGFKWDYNETFRSDDVTPFNPSTELGGFKAYCNNDGSLTTFPITFPIPDPAARAFASSPQPAGSYNCVMTAYDTEDRESVVSSIITIVLDIPAPKSVTGLVGEALP